ncbi:hypothetical protein ACOCEA_14835 [Maribacter sp. CXY002]|uniref:hypothetical protein n=1 Tax=Maribacter luteocoastalis TaxID=3407671 RepID=UPI003B67DCAB
MKKTPFIKTVFIVAFAFTVSCSDDESSEREIPVRATPQAFAQLKSASLENKVQNFQLDASQTGFFTTENGVFFVINGNCLSRNGNPVTGMVDVQVVELYDRGAMLTTDKPTMGALPNGDKALMVSGGEFFLTIAQDGEPVDEDCDIVATIPADLTGGADMGMTLWKGNGGDQDCDRLDDDCDGFVWTENLDANGNPLEADVQDGDQGERFYVAPFGDFGWTNVDRFFSDPRPKTTILVEVPEGFNDENSRVYLSYAGEPNALAYLDTYDSATGRFSEHYGQIPIGLECHVIFTSEENEAWLYAIKSVTIVDGQTIVIEETDLQTSTESELEALINSLP